MATGTAKSRPSTPAAAADQVVQFDQYIERRVNKTRTHVKLVDLAAALMVLLVGTMSYLLVVAVVDHWVVGFSTMGRFVALVVLIGGVGCFVARYVVPLLIKRINPVYAARTIEQTAPTLRNNLVNYLLFRANPADVRSVVLDAVREQAADGLSGVSVDVSVDRARVIKIGYVLVALVALCGLYKIFSPKDPWQSVMRVAIPWSDTARPSRVTIEDVQPGDASVYFGQLVTVQAAISGVREDEQVTLYYTTDDGQTVDREIAMRIPQHELHYQATLPEDPDGVRQGLVYRIEVGDAVSAEYRITALTAPSITVRSVHYDFPFYTSKSEESRRHGDIEALEGTRVTVTAEANREITSAQINIVPEDEESAENGRQFVRMTPDGTTARGSFYLPRSSSRHEVERLNYEVKFTAVGDKQGATPVRHVIKVEPDLPPIVEVLTPVKAAVDVPEDGAIVIEARSIDPDYALTSVTLRAEARRVDVVRELLLEAPTGHVGSALRTYRFVPRQLGLRAGQVVDYWVVATDNRAAFPSGTADHNISRTMNRQLRIVEATGQGDSQPMGGEPTDNDDSPAGESGDTESGDTEAGETGEGQFQPAGGENGGEGTSAEGSAGQENSSAGSDPSAEGQPGGGEPNAGPQPGADGQPHEANEPGDASDDSSAEGGQEGAGQSGDAPGEPGSNDREPVASDGSQDGDAMQRILDHIEQEAGDVENADQPLDGQPLDDQPLDDQPLDDQSLDDQPLEGDAGEGAENSSAGGEGGGTDGAARTDEGAENPSSDDEAGADPGQGDNGPSGEGQHEEGSDAPEAQGENQQTDKQQSADDEEAGEAGEAGEAQSPSTSPKQSDSSGEEEGDRSGGGGKGGGQSAQQPGNDGAGSSTAADDGAGAAGEAGEGETSGEGGDGGKADGPTGESGDSAGPGSGSGAPPPEGGQPGAGAPGGEEGGDPAAGQPGGEGAGSPAEAGQSGPPTAGPPSDQQPTAGGQPGGGGQGTDGEHGESSDEAAPDDPNLEHARQATDLVLDFLKDQQHDPDQELLDKLGWKKGDVQRFLRRWEQLKRQSGRDDPHSRDELDDALRSLGVTPQSSQFRQGDDRNDDLSRLQDAGHRTAPPPEYLDQFRAFQKSNAKD